MLKYREVAKTFVKVDVQSKEMTSFWYNSWTHLGRLIDHRGRRGRIDLGTPVDYSVELVLRMHRRRRQQVEVLNSIEDLIETQQMDMVMMWY